MKSARRLTFAILFAGAYGCTEPAPAPEPQPEVEAEAPAETAVQAPPEVELDQIRTRLEAAKARLFDEGKYNCCVQPSCDWCALHEGSCSCLENLTGGDAVCPGCGLGWHNGQGIAEGIEARSVKWNITHEHPAGGHKH